MHEMQNMKQENEQSWFWSSDNTDCWLLYWKQNLLFRNWKLLRWSSPSTFFHWKSNNSLGNWFGFEHAWQGRHRLRDENPKRISAIMEKLQTICRSNASTFEHKQARVSLFGETAESLEQFTHRRSVFQPNEVHVGVFPHQKVLMYGLGSCHGVFWMWRASRRPQVWHADGGELCAHPWLGSRR